MAKHARPTLTGIQLLRGLAASMVVVSHTNTMMSHAEFFGRSPFPIAQTGLFGVAVFFVISGFIIVYVSLKPDMQPRIALPDFAFRRFVRIVPFMWLCAVGYNVLSYAATHEVEWLAFMRAMVLFPIGELKPNVLWSLRHEAIFYALFAISLLGSRRRLWPLFAWFAAPVAYGALLAVTNGAAEPANPALAEMLRVVLLGSDVGANLQFAAGFAIGLLLIRKVPAFREQSWAGLPLTIAAAVLSAAVVEWLALPVGLARFAVWTVLALPVIWLALISPARDSALSRVAIVLGDASFSIYLVHNAVILMLFKLAVPLTAYLSLPALYAGVVACAIGAGIVVHYLVEAPLIAWVTARWGRPALNGPAPQAST